MKTFAWLAVVLLAAVTARADRTVPVVFTLAATVYVQNANTSTNGAVINTGPTVLYQVTTASLLKNLAQAEYAKSNYPAPVFPKSAKLVLLVNLDDAAQSHFCVMNTNGTVFADVSDLLSFHNDGNSGTHRGGFHPATGTLVKATYAYMGTIDYDDTSAPGGRLKYYLTGLFADRENDVVNTQAGTFRRTTEMKSLCVSGSGTFAGNNLSGGGTVVAAGSATLPLW